MSRDLYEWLVEFVDDDGQRFRATVVADSYIKAVSKARDKTQAGAAMVSLLERMGGTRTVYDATASKFIANLLLDDGKHGSADS